LVEFRRKVEKPRTVGEKEKGGGNFLKGSLHPGKKKIKEPQGRAQTQKNRGIRFDERGGGKFWLRGKKKTTRERGSPKNTRGPEKQNRFTIERTEIGGGGD